MNSQKIRIAYHESSHAIMALVCGQKIQCVSLVGNEAYPGFVKLENTRPMDAISEIRICLAGGVGESLLLDNTIKIAIDDFDRAIRSVEYLLLSNPHFAKRAQGLIDPGLEAMVDVENPLVRACIADCIDDCVRFMSRLKPLILMIAEELLSKDELGGDEVSRIYSSFVKQLQSKSN